MDRGTLADMEPAGQDQPSRVGELRPKWGRHEDLREPEGGSNGVGAKPAGSVSKKTFCVVVSDALGATKIAKAESPGTPMIDASMFSELLASGQIPPG